MTIRIVIQNDDTPSDGVTRVVRVRPMLQAPNGERSPALGSSTITGGMRVDRGSIVLRPGETTEAWLHSGQMVEVFEGEAAPE